MAYTIVRPSTHQGWLDERRKGIGASDAGTVMGVSPFKTPMKLWMQKTGKVGDDPETPAMREGHWLEFATAAAFEELTGATVDRSTEGDWIAVNDQKPFLRVSPDRCYWPAGTPKEMQTPHNWCVLECKSTNRPVNPDELPVHWILQLQYQMGVLGAKKGTLIWFDKSTHANEPSFGCKEFDFKPNTFKTITDAIEHFWTENVLKDVPPAPVTGDDVSMIISGTDPQKRVLAPDDLILEIEHLKDLKAEGNRIKELVEQTSNRIKVTMLDAEILSAPNGKVLATWKPSNTSVFDRKTFEEDHEELYESYCDMVLNVDRLRQDYPELVKQYTDTVKSKSRTLRIN